MKMKKLVSVLLVAACVVSLTACGSGEDSGKGGADSKTAISGPDDLAGKKIGVQLGTTGDLYTTDEFGDECIERFNKGAEAVQSLKQNKIDAVVIDNEPAKEFVEANEGLKILDTAYAEEDYALAFEKGSKLKDEFNEVIAELKEDGTFDAIVAYYIEGKGEKYESPADTKYANGKLVMATNAEFPPYEYWENEQIMGIDADFAKAICDKLGYELEISDMAFDAIIPAVTSGKADFAAAGMTVTEERQKEVDFSDSYYTGVQVIIVNE